MSEEERRLVHRGRRDVLLRHWLVAQCSTSSKLGGYSDRLPRTTVWWKDLKDMIPPQHLHLALLADQFAYRPTCSTTAALVALEHHTAQYLESDSFVRCLLIDYSKAFDTISHPILFQKLLDLNLKPNIVTWIYNFLTGRTHSVSFGGILSHWKSITASIVGLQGSGIGPCLYIIYAKDLNLSHPLM